MQIEMVWITLRLSSPVDASPAGELATEHKKDEQIAARGFSTAIHYDWEFTNWILVRRAFGEKSQIHQAVRVYFQV